MKSPGYKTSLSNLLRQHRMIGINHVLGALKTAGLISHSTTYASDAVGEIGSLLGRPLSLHRRHLASVKAHRLSRSKKKV